jgi:hypothetical protein
MQASPPPGNGENFANGLPVHFHAHQRQLPLFIFSTWRRFQLKSIIFYLGNSYLVTFWVISRSTKERNERLPRKAA